MTDKSTKAHRRSQQTQGSAESKSKAAVEQAVTFGSVLSAVADTRDMRAGFHILKAKLSEEEETLLTQHPM